MVRSVDEFAPKIPSGIDAIDRVWGGVYDGGVYLVYGRVSNGRGLVGLLFSQIGAALDERTLFVSADRSKDLIIQAASIGFDIRRAHRLGVFKLVRTEQLLRNPAESPSHDASAFDRLISQVRSFSPRRLVISDIMAFAGEMDPLSPTFRSMYIRFLDQIEPLGTTVVIMLPEPTSDVARRFTEFIMSRSTAAIFVGRDDDSAEVTDHQITLIPQIGHVTRKATVAWNLASLVRSAEQVDATYKALRGRIAASRASFLLPPPAAVLLTDTPEAEPVAPEPRRTAEPEIVEEFVPSQTLDELATRASDPEPFSIVDRVLDEVLSAPITTAPGQASSTAPLEQLEEAHVRDEPGGDGVDVDLNRSGRTGFTRVLQSAFDTAAAHNTNFLLVAMRVDDTNVSPVEFLSISDGVSGAIRDKDALYADARRGRLVLMMPGASADHAQELFAVVKQQLRDQRLPRADELLRHVSAIVVPNGNPFGNAAEFLSYVLDGE